MTISLFLKVWQTDVTVGLVVGGWFLFLEGMVVPSPAVAPVGRGGGQPHIVGGEPGLAVSRSERVAEQFCGVESSTRGVGTAPPGQARPGVRHLALSLSLVPQVVVGVGVPGEGPVGGAPRLQGTGSPCRAGAPVTSDLADRTAAAPGTSHTAAGLHRPGRGHARTSRPPVTVPATHTGLAAAAAVPDVVVYPRVPRPGGLARALGSLGAPHGLPVGGRGVGGVVAVGVGPGHKQRFIISKLDTFSSGNIQMAGSLI